MKNVIIYGALATAIFSLSACNQTAPDGVESGGATEPAVRAEDRPNQLVVIGIDGAEWSVIEEMWAQGELPNLKALADAGVSERLATDYGESPMIWTSIATGMVAERHGITGFVVAGEEGTSIPVSSATRKVPALWNIVPSLGRKLGVLGWWATWPAEEIEGATIISDRGFWSPEDGIWPAEFRSRVADIKESTDKMKNRFGGAEPNRTSDLLNSFLAAEMVTEDYDLVMMYYRTVDMDSHWYWKYYRPEGFDLEGISPERRELLADRIPESYRATDEMIGKIVDAAGSDANVLVVSDHGFVPLIPEEIKVNINSDRMLERLGLLKRNEAGDIDIDATVLYTVETPTFRPNKRMRWGGAATPQARIRALQTLRDLKFDNDRRAFNVRKVNGDETFDVVANVILKNATEVMMKEDRVLQGVVQSVRHISGNHDKTTDGIFIAAGPDFRTDAELDGISIFDITPTVLQTIGLPVARDFDGRPASELLTVEHRKEFPLQVVDSWGSRDGGLTQNSEEDEKLIEQLRSLGYLD